jgi:hypothetical protein
VRVNVKGISCSGKSTFSRELAERLSVPYLELDAVHHGPNWTEASAEELQARVREFMASAHEGWVIDGNYEPKLGNLVLGAADRIVCRSAAQRCPGARRRTSTGSVIASSWNGNRAGAAAFGTPVCLDVRSGSDTARVAAVRYDARVIRLRHCEVPLARRARAQFLTWRHDEARINILYWQRFS